MIFVLIFQNNRIELWEATYGKSIQRPCELGRWIAYKKVYESFDFILEKQILKIRNVYRTGFCEQLVAKKLIIYQWQHTSTILLVLVVVFVQKTNKPARAMRLRIS